MEIKLKDMVECYVSSLPTVYYKLQEALDDDDSTFEDVADIILRDPALSARLLKIVNSPFYGLANKVDTITHALSVVGTYELQMMVLATTLVRQFQGLPKDLITVDSYWRHSIATGLAAREIALTLEKSGVEHYYIAGMLHDLGSLVIYNRAPDPSREILEECQLQELPLYVVENDRIGFNHMEVGAGLLQAWKLPESLCEATRYHHYPSQAENFEEEAMIIHAADWLTHEMDLGNNGEPCIPQLENGVFKKLDLSREDMEAVRESVFNKVEDAVGVFL